MRTSYIQHDPIHINRSMDHDTAFYEYSKYNIDNKNEIMSFPHMNQVNNDTSCIYYDKSISIKNLKSFDDHSSESNAHISQICKQSYTISKEYGIASLFLSSDKVLNGIWILTDRHVSVEIDTDIRDNKSFLKLVENNVEYYRKEINDNMILKDKRCDSFFFFFDDDHYVGLYFNKMKDSYLFKSEMDKRKLLSNKQIENEVTMKNFPHMAFIQATTQDEYPKDYTNVSFRVNNIPISWKAKFKSIELIKSIDSSRNIAMCSMKVTPKDSHDLKDKAHEDTIKFNKAKEKLFQFTHNLVKDNPIREPLKIKRDSIKKKQMDEINPRDELMDQIKGYTLNYLKKTPVDDHPKVEEEVQYDSNDIHDAFNMALRGRRKDISGDEEDDDDW